VQRQYDTRGEVSDDAKRRLADSRASLAKLLQSASQLADLADQPASMFAGLEAVTVVDEDAALDGALPGEDGGAIVAGRALPTAEEMGGGLWEDAETQAFYESLPLLREMLPGILFRDSEKPTLPLLQV